MSNSFLNIGEEENGQNALAMALELDSSIADDMEQKYPYIKDQVKKVKSKEEIKLRNFVFILLLFFLFQCERNNLITKKLKL
jgi:hypothetical protein